MNTKFHYPLLRLAVAAVLLSAATTLPAATFVWTGVLSSDWSTAGNWNPAGVPGSADSATIENGSVDAGPGVTIPSLLLSGGTLSGKVMVTTLMGWASGTVGGALTVAGSGVLNITGTDNKTLTGVITNYGRVTWSGGPLGFYGGAFYNGMGGMFDEQFDGSLYYGSGSPFILNQGTFRKSGGSGNTSVGGGLLFTNASLVDIQGGSLVFPSGLTTSGAFQVATNAAVTLSGGTVVLAPGYSFSGAGFYGINGGSVTLVGELNNPGFTLTGGGTLLGTNELATTLNWVNGTVGGALTVASNGVLNITGSDNKTLTGVITNYGRVTWSGGPLGFYGGAFYNGMGGMFDEQFDGSLYYGSGSPFILNQGTFRKSGGSGNTSVGGGLLFTNASLVDIQGGSLVFPSGLTTSGAFQVATNAAVTLSGGTVVLAPGYSFSGAGFYGINGGSVTLVGRLNSPGLTLAGGGTLLGTNELATTLNWVNGTVGGALTVASNGVLNITGSDNKTLTGVITNYGRVTWSGGPLGFYGGAFYNGMGGMFDEQFDGSLYYGSGSPFILNQGTFRKSGGDGTTSIGGGIVFSNLGTVDAESGTLGFDQSYTQAGGTLNFGLGSLTDFGRIHFIGRALLSGTLSVTLKGGYIPAVGSSFAALTYDSHLGSFTNLTFPTPLIGWQLDYGDSVVNILSFPLLTISRTGQTVVVSWPAGVFAGFRLEATDALGSSAQWKAVIPVPIQPAERLYLTNTASLSSQFYRLRKP